MQASERGYYLADQLCFQPVTGPHHLVQCHVSGKHSPGPVGSCTMVSALRISSWGVRFARFSLLMESFFCFGRFSVFDMSFPLADFRAAHCRSSLKTVETALPISPLLHRGLPPPLPPGWIFVIPRHSSLGAGLRTNVARCRLACGREALLDRDHGEAVPVLGREHARRRS